MRNVYVEQATDLLLSKLDQLISGGYIAQHVPRDLQKILDDHATEHGGSVRLASVFLLAYSLLDPAWDFDTVPVGIRGTYGDKRIAAGLSSRYVTYHNNITAFGENLGWKGSVKNFSLARDPRFGAFIQALRKLSVEHRQKLLDHAVWKMFESRVVPKAIPALPPSYLTHARATLLCETIIRIPSEGHLPQFLVAAFLTVHRKRSGGTVVTHHPHAADKFDGTFGDIEEYREDVLVAAYEVTVRDDWKNRIPALHSKMQAASLRRYVLITNEVTGSLDLSPASNLVKFTDALGFDLAIVDIHEFFRVFCAELSASELAAAFNLAYDYVRDVRLCGRPDIVASYAEAVAHWLDTASAGQPG